MSTVKKAPEKKAPTPKATAPAKPVLVKPTLPKVEADNIIMVSPSALLLGANVRYKMQKHLVDRMKKTILDEGKVPAPILVTPLDDEAKAENPGREYLVITGNIRTTAAQELNDKDGAGVMVPCIVRAPQDELSRLTTQIRENNERNQMNPIDCAVAIKQCFDAGMTRPQIRDLFPRVAGKAIGVQPASNSWLNETLKFLEFPKKIQDKIADGRIPVGAALNLYDEPKDKWDTILEAIESKRLKDLDKEDKLETKFLEGERKESQLSTKEVEINAKLEEAKKIAEAAEAELQAKRVATKESYDKRVMAAADLAKEERAKLEAEHKAADKAAKEALVAAEKAKAALAKVEQTKAKQAEIAAEKKVELEKKRAEAAAASAKKPITSTEVKNAAADVSGKPKPPTYKDLVFGLKSLVVLSKPMTRYSKTILIGTKIDEFIQGKIMDGQLHLAISQIVGEAK